MSAAIQSIHRKLHDEGKYQRVGGRREWVREGEREREREREKERECEREAGGKECKVTGSSVAIKSRLCCFHWPKWHRHTHTEAL